MKLAGLAAAAVFACVSAPQAASITAADISLGPLSLDDAAVPSENTLFNSGGVLIQVNLLTGSTLQIVVDATGSGLLAVTGIPTVELSDLRFDMPADLVGVELTSGTEELILSRVVTPDMSPFVTETLALFSISDFVIVDNPQVPFFDPRQVWEFALTIEPTGVDVPLPASMLLLLTGLADLAATRHCRAAA